jgi:hypothetical protein
VRFTSHRGDPRFCACPDGRDWIGPVANLQRLNGDLFLILHINTRLTVQTYCEKEFCSPICPLWNSFFPCQKCEAGLQKRLYLSVILVSTRISDNRKIQAMIIAANRKEFTAQYNTISLDIID